MLAMLLLLEDNQVKTERLESGKWLTTIQDGPTGKSKTLELSDHELATLLYLAINNDDPTDPVTTALYPQAEEILKSFPPECRIIP